MFQLQKEMVVASDLICDMLIVMFRYMLRVRGHMYLYGFIQLCMKPNNHNYVCLIMQHQWQQSIMIIPAMILFL